MEGNPPPGDTAATRISCTRCRLRKIKCNRQSPCDQCSSASATCIFPARQPRRKRQGGEASQSRDAKLLSRIKRLEVMLAERNAANQSGGVLLQPLRNENDGARVSDGVPVDDHYADFVRQQGDSARYLNSEFWASLGREFDGLRELIGEPEYDDEGSEEEEDKLIGDFPSDGMGISPNLIFPNSSDCASVDMKDMYPSNAHFAVLTGVFWSRVDPICKVLHRPTVDAYFSDMRPLIDSATGRFKFRSLEAVACAVYLAAVTSMSTEECQEKLGEERHILMLRYKKGTELALVQSNFLNGLEIFTLQAFVIYITAQRSFNKARNTWALTGIAVRIAHGLGMHRDGDGRSFGAFEAEMRRRLWGHILTLDLRASEDLGVESTLGEASYTTLPPNNVDDADYWYDTQHPLRSRMGPTSTSLSLLALDALRIAQKINYGSLGRTPEELLPFPRTGEDLVRNFAERVESIYLVTGNPLDSHYLMTRLMGHYWTYKLWLNLYYPLRKREYMRSPVQGLETAVRFLSVCESIENHQWSPNLAWSYRTYVPWHALAVALSELCIQPSGHTANRAWDIIDRRWRDWVGRVADVKETMLWGPIKKLLKQAKAVRARIFPVSDPQPFDTDSLLREFGAGGDHGVPEEPPESFGVFDTSRSFDMNLNQTLDLLPFDSMTDVGIEEAGSGNPTNWNEFMFDLNALGGVEGFPGLWEGFDELNQ